MEKGKTPEVANRNINCKHGPDVATPGWLLSKWRRGIRQRLGTRLFQTWPPTSLYCSRRADMTLTLHRRGGDVPDVARTWIQRVQEDLKNTRMPPPDVQRLQTWFPRVLD